MIFSAIFNACIGGIVPDVDLSLFECDAWVAVPRARAQSRVRHRSSREEAAPVSMAAMRGKGLVMFYEDDALACPEACPVIPQL